MGKELYLPVESDKNSSTLIINLLRKVYISIKKFDNSENFTLQSLKVQNLCKYEEGFKKKKLERRRYDKMGGCLRKEGEEFICFEKILPSLI